MLRPRWEGDKQGRTLTGEEGLNGLGDGEGEQVREAPKTCLRQKAAQQPTRRFPFGQSSGLGRGGRFDR